MRAALLAVVVAAGVAGVAGGQPVGPDPPKTTLVPLKSRLWQAAPTPDGKGVVTVTGDERTLRVWDAAGKARTWEQGATDAGSVVFAPDGTVLVGRRDGTVSRHDLATGKELDRAAVGEKGNEGMPFFPLAAGTYGEPRFDLSPDGTLIALGNPNGLTVRLVRWPSGRVFARLVNEPRDGERWASPVRFGPGGKTLYCLCEGDARGFVAVWDLATRTQTRALVPPRPVSEMTVSHDGRLVGVVGGFNRTVTVWDAAADFKQTDLPHPGDNCHGVAFSRDGTRAAAVSTYSMGRKGARATVWDLATRRPVRSWNVSDDYYHGGIVFFSHDGRTLYTGGQNVGLHAWTLLAPER
jgi:WD40 repeat protein